MLEPGQAYRIKDWDKHFENSESRKLRNVSRVFVPNKHDGKGYARIARSKKSCQVLAGWMLILQVASKCPQRGLLVDEDGALDAEDLADMTRLPEDVFSIALHELVDPKVGWIEVCVLPKSLMLSGRDGGTLELASRHVPKNPKISQNVPVDPGTSRSRPDSTVQNSTVGNSTEITPIVPQEGELFGDDWENIFPSGALRKSKGQQKRIKISRPHPGLARLGKLFGRGEKTLPTVYEASLYRDLNPTEEELKAIETYYRSGAEYLRKTLETLLNNWHSELDRANERGGGKGGSGMPGGRPVLR